MSKWRTASAIEAIKQTAEYIHIRRQNQKDLISTELFGTIARCPFALNNGEQVWAVGLSTRRTDKMPSKRIGRQAALGRAARAAAEELGLVTKSSAVDETGAYSIIRGLMTDSQFELFRHLCEQAPDHATVHFNTALQAPALLEAA